MSCPPEKDPATSIDCAACRHQQHQPRRRCFFWRVRQLAPQVANGQVPSANEPATVVPADDFQLARRQRTQPRFFASSARLGRSSCRASEPAPACDCDWDQQRFDHRGKVRFSRHMPQRWGCHTALGWTDLRRAGTESARQWMCENGGNTTFLVSNLSSQRLHACRVRP